MWHPHAAQILGTSAGVIDNVFPRGVLHSTEGPTIAGAVMHASGPQGLLLFAAGCFLAVALFTTYRALRRRAKTPEEQSDYVAVPLTQGTYGAPELDPRGEYKPHPPSPSAQAARW